MMPQTEATPEIGQSSASVPDAGAQKDAAAKPADLSGQYVCPECLTPFRPRVLRQLFCCAEHKRDWHHRSTKRGAVLFSLEMAARETRDGTRGDKDTGKRASWQGNLLKQQWRDEDRAAGRMSQVDYMRRRFALGFDAI